MCVKIMLLKRAKNSINVLGKIKEYNSLLNRLIKYKFHFMKPKKSQNN